MIELQKTPACDAHSAVAGVPIRYGNWRAILKNGRALRLCWACVQRTLHELPIGDTVALQRLASRRRLS